LGGVQLEVSCGGLSCEEAEDNDDWRQNENQGDNWLVQVDLEMAVCVYVNIERTRQGDVHQYVLCLCTW